MTELATPPIDRSADLLALLARAKQHPPYSPERQKLLTQIIRLVAPKLWKQPVPHYNDALQLTWEHLCRNLERYDPTRASLSTWLNGYLRWRLHDLAHNAEIPASQLGDGALPSEAFLTLGDRAQSPTLAILEAVQQWAQDDDTGELRQLHIKGHPTITAQCLILRRLPPETSWKDLSAEFGVPIPTLSGFYQQKCLPRLRAFGEAEGYL